MATDCLRWQPSVQGAYAPKLREEPCSKVERRALCKEHMLPSSEKSHAPRLKGEPHITELKGVEPVRTNATSQYI